MQGLEDRFQMLQTDNGRLKSELMGAQRLIEAQGQEGLQREQEKRALQYRVEDAAHDRDLLEDTFQRQLQAGRQELAQALAQVQELQSWQGRDAEKVRR